MAIRHTLSLPCIADARLFGSTWDNTGPGDTQTITTGVFSGTQHYGFLRFGEIAIPAYARIVSAVFRFYVSGGTDNSRYTHVVSGVKDNGTLWTESSRNGAGRDTTATSSIVLASKTGEWKSCNISAIAAAWQQGQMDATRGICITCGTANSYKIIDGRWRTNAPTLTIVYEIPASVPVPSASTIELGQQLTVNLTGVEDGVTHEVRYKIGENTLYTDDIGGGTVSEYMVPISAGQQFPTDPTGVLTVEVETYDANDVSRGTVTADVLLTLPSDKNPTTTRTASILKTPGDPSIGAYVQHRTGRRMAFVGTGKYGATIASYEVTAEGVTRTGNSPLEHPLFTTSGQVEFKYAVYDSRGYSTSYTENVPVLPWQVPQIQTFSVIRVDSNHTPASDGTCILATIKATVSSLIVDTQQNNLKYMVAYRQIFADGLPPGNWALADEVDAADIEVDTAFVLQSDGEDITAFDDMSGYEFRVYVSDIYATSAQDTQIATSEIIVDYHASAASVAIGGKSTAVPKVGATPANKKFEVYNPAYFYDGIPQFDYSTDRIDTKRKWIDGKTIYCKVLTFGEIAGGSTLNISIGESAIASVVRLDGFARYGSDLYLLPFLNINNNAYQFDIAITAPATNPAVRIRTSSSISSTGGYVVIEYTLP